LRVDSGSSTKTAGGSLAGKESIDASSTRRSRRLRCSSDMAGSLIWILRTTIVAIAELVKRGDPIGRESESQKPGGFGQRLVKEPTEPSGIRRNS
jgi:hypothetical protein